MYDINPPAVYAHETVMVNPTFRGRVERVVGALKEPRDIVTYTDDQLPDMIKDGLTACRRPMKKLPEVRDPILLFNTFRFDSAEAILIGPLVA